MPHPTLLSLSKGPEGESFSPGSYSPSGGATARGPRRSRHGRCRRDGRTGWLAVDDGEPGAGFRLASAGKPRRMDYEDEPSTHEEIAGERRRLGARHASLGIRLPKEMSPS